MEYTKHIVDNTTANQKKDNQIEEKEKKETQEETNTNKAEELLQDSQNQMDPDDIPDECDLEILCILSESHDFDSYFTYDGNEEVVYRDLADEFIEEYYE